MDEMTEANTRDYADKNAADDLARSIDNFLERAEVPKSRLSHHWVNQFHRDDLTRMSQELKELSAHIVRVWD